jgi:hypothetical protein
MLELIFASLSAIRNGVSKLKNAGLFDVPHRKQWVSIPYRFLTLIR